MHPFKKLCQKLRQLWSRSQSRVTDLTRRMDTQTRRGLCGSMPLAPALSLTPMAYILTNAHVVRGAQRIRIILPPPPVDSPFDFQPVHGGQILAAKLIGEHKDSDIALLK